MSSAEQTRRPAVLTEEGLHSDLVARPLVEAGFVVDSCPFEDIPEVLEEGRHNVLLLGRFYLMRRTKQEERQHLRRLGDAIERFLERGGGVFISMPALNVVPTEHVLERFDVGFLPVKIEQESNVVRDGGRAFGYTRAVAGPAAAGEVEGIWYPIAMGHAPATRPVVTAGNAWRVIVRGPEDSHTEALEQEGYGLPGRELEGFEESVPLLAVRDDVGGRLAVCGIPGPYYLWPPHNCPIAEPLLTAGFDERPSDLLKLVENMLGWLAEPSMESGKLGGATTDPEALEPQAPRFPDDPPVKWAEREFPPDPRVRRGLIGARTSLTVGAGTVEDYVEKASEAGHDFIVFLEDFKQLDEEKLEDLKTACERHTTEEFWAVPGYTFEDVVGCHYFVFGWELELPLEDLLSEDGKRLASHERGDGRSNGRIEVAHLSLVFGELGQRCRKGAYLHDENPKMFIDNRFNDSIGLVTWHDGRVVDDQRHRYHALMDKGVRLNPAALTLLDGPEDFDRALDAGWLNVLSDPYEQMQDRVLRKRMAPELEWWGKIEAEVAGRSRYYFDSWQYGRPFQSITNGPIVRTWAVSASDRDPEWRAPDSEIPPTADWFRTDVTQFRLRIRVTSEIGLDEVRLMDGDRLIRCWNGRGEEDWESELDLQHHQQMHLMVEARDREGGAAYTSDFLTYRRDWCEFYCADRNNPLCIGYQKDERGYADNWAGAEHLTYNSGQWGGNSPWIGKWWYSEDRISPVPRDPLRDETLPVDGGVGQAGAGVKIRPRMPHLDPPEPVIASGAKQSRRCNEREPMLEPFQRLISTDVAICDFTCDRGYDPDAGYFFDSEAGFGLYGAHPTRYLHVERRGIVFRPRPHSLTTLLYDYEVSWKRDPELDSPLRIGTIEGGTVCDLYRSGGWRQQFLMDDPYGSSGRWERGEWLVCWTDGARPAMFLNEGANLLLVGDGEGGLGVCIPPEELPMRRRSTRLRFTAIGGTYEDRAPDILRRVRSMMGFDCEPAYDIRIDEGRVLSRRLVLELEAGEAGAAFEIPAADLPMALPVTVSGLNDNWPAVLVDRATNRWRPLGMLEGTAYATLDTTAGDSHIFIGHPLVADRPDIVLSLSRVAEDEYAVEIHNPTGRVVETTVRRPDHFPLIRWQDHHLRLAPGESQQIRIRMNGAD